MVGVHVVSLPTAKGEGCARLVFGQELMASPGFSVDQLMELAGQSFQKGTVPWISSVRSMGVSITLALGDSFMREPWEPCSKGKLSAQVTRHLRIADGAQSSGEGDSRNQE